MVDFSTKIGVDLIFLSLSMRQDVQHIKKMLLLIKVVTKCRHWDIKTL